MNPLAERTCFSQVAAADAAAEAAEPTLCAVAAGGSACTKLAGGGSCAPFVAADDGSCSGHGSCSVGIDGAYACACADGFSGASCEAFDSYESRECLACRAETFKLDPGPDPNPAAATLGQGGAAPPKTACTTCPYGMHTAGTGASAVCVCAGPAWTCEDVRFTTNVNLTLATDIGAVGGSPGGDTAILHCH